MANTIDNQNAVLNLILNHPGEYSKEQVANYFQVSTKTIENYMKSFLNTGIVVKSRKKLLKLSQKTKEVEVFEEVCGKEDLRKIAMLNILYNEFGQSCEFQHFVNRCIEEELLKTESETYIEKLLRQMKKDDLIDYKNRIIYKKVNNLKDIDKNDLRKLVFYLNLIKEITPKTKTFNNILVKLGIACEKINNNIVTVKNSNNVSIFDEKLVSDIEEAIVNEDILTIKYINGNNIWENIIFPIGIIYSYHKDAWYVKALKKCNKGKYFNEIYRLDKVICVNRIEKKYKKTNKDVKEEHKEEDPNFIFRDNMRNLNKKCNLFNKELYENSLGISEEKLSSIKVKFENEIFIERKVDEYIAQRKNATKRFEGDFIILEDKVNGINEFSAWVKHFGKSAECIEPIALREKLINDVTKLKERYGI